MYEFGMHYWNRRECYRLTLYVEWQFMYMLALQPVCACDCSCTVCGPALSLGDVRLLQMWETYCYVVYGNI